MKPVNYLCLIILFACLAPFVAGQDPQTDAALRKAAQDGDLQTVKDLLAKGADVNAKDNDGETALMIAASQSNPGILTELIEAGADINAQNNSGRTALMAAAFRANIEEIKLLLAKGADLKLKDKKDRTAFDLAKDGSKNYHDETNRKRFAEAFKLLEVTDTLMEVLPRTLSDSR